MSEDTLKFIPGKPHIQVSGSENDVLVRTQWPGGPVGSILVHVDQIEELIGALQELAFNAQINRDWAVANAQRKDHVE